MTIQKDSPQSHLRRYVTFRVANEFLGIPVDQTQEVLPARAITPIPLANPEISGFLNLRGQIVTTIDLRLRLGLPPRQEGDKSINIIIRDSEDLISLVVDEVGDVMHMDETLLGPPPATLDARWREYCNGVFQLEKGLLVVIDTPKVLDIQVAS